MADGSPVAGCYWHPWWGYLCSGYYRTFKGTDFSCGGAGLRYDFPGGSFVCGSYSVYKLDIGGDAADPQLQSLELEYGWRF